jgi:uncharacterized protein
MNILKNLSKRHYFLIAAFLLISLFLASYKFLIKNQNYNSLSPLSSFKKQASPTPKPLEKYEFANLKKRGGKESEIVLEKVLKEEEKFISYLFSYKSEGRKITGFANIPKKPGRLPVIVMLRGYVDQEIYKTGVGTQRAGEVYAQNDFITLAPDFLGYGESDMPPNDVWEERFLRPLTVLDLLASVKSLKNANKDKIGLWGHSNGGMIALTVLELTAKNYPTTLWAPVSQFFPYDILYYTFEFDDKGKALRKSLSEFEKDYDTDNYSFDEYLDWINAPVQIHQGAADPYIPVSWSKNLVERLTSLDKDIVLYTYQGADHNLSEVWNNVVQKDIKFFKFNLKI